MTARWRARRSVMTPSLPHQGSSRGRPAAPIRLRDRPLPRSGSGTGPLPGRPAPRRPGPACAPAGPGGYFPVRVSIPATPLREEGEGPGWRRPDEGRPDMKQYLLAVHMTGEPAPSEEEMQQAYQAVDAFNDELRSAGTWV